MKLSTLALPYATFNVCLVKTFQFTNVLIHYRIIKGFDLSLLNEENSCLVISTLNILKDLKQINETYLVLTPKST